MNLRAKIFLSIVLMMFITTALLAANIMGEGLRQQHRERERFNRFVQLSVGTWMRDALGDDPATVHYDRSREDLEKIVNNSATWRPRSQQMANHLVRDVVLVDQFRVVIAHSPGAELPEPVRATPESKPVVALPDIELATVLKTGGPPMIGIAQQRVYIALWPRENMRLHDAHNTRKPPEQQPTRPVGLVLTLNLPPTEQGGGRELVWSILGFMGLGTVLLIMTIYWLLYRLVVQPLERLTASSKLIASGDYAAALSDLQPGDGEISSLVTAFDRMAREVQGYQTSLQSRVDQAVQQKRRAEQGLIIAQRLAATGTLAAGMAHEINNPLTGMQNAARRLAQRVEKGGDLTTDMRVKTYLELIIEGLTQVEDIVKRVLQFSRRRFSPEPFSMVEAIDRAMGLARHKLDRFEVAIRIDKPESLPLCFGERGEIEQVFLNLIINAVDAIRSAREMPGRAPDLVDEVVVKVRDTDEGIHADIVDTGRGMTTDEAAHCFDAFYTTKPGNEGTGLGLAIVHNIIDSHGGSIHIDTAYGRGTTVSFTIPKHLEE